MNSSMKCQRDKKEFKTFFLNLLFRNTIAATMMNDISKREGQMQVSLPVYTEVFNKPTYTRVLSTPMDNTALGWSYQFVNYTDHYMALQYAMPQCPHETSWRPYL